MRAKTDQFLFAAVLAFLAAVCATAGVGLTSIPDVRVGPLLDSHWNQALDSGYVNTGKHCFNLLTPNHYRVGCSAVPMAQIIRYWGWPARIKAQSFVCSVDGVQTTLQTTGDDYVWDEMPGITTLGTTDAHCNAIGKLAYDCAVSLHSMFAAGATTAFGSLVFVPLKEVFGYANAIGYGRARGASFDFSAVQETVFASLDAGAPVVISMCESTPNGLGHVAVIDGYGFKDGRPYIHMNLGYGDVSPEAADVWYEPSNVIVLGTLYDKIDGIIYNIFPLVSGDVLSGRVLQADGRPAVGVEVTAVAGKETTVTTTGAAGVYAFVLTGGKTYTVSAGNASRKVALKASVSSNVSWTKPFAPVYVNNQFGKLGNSWGNDLTVTSLTPTPDPEPDPDPEPEPAAEFGGFNPLAAATLTGVIYDAADVPCGTITFKIGKKSKKGESSVSGSILMLDGKKYSIKSYKATVNEGYDCSFTASVAKLGTASVVLGDKGFAVEVEQLSGGLLHARPADITAGLLKPSTAFFHVEGDFPAEIGGYEVLAACTPEGEPINVNAKGKWEARKAATPKLKKLRVKGEDGKTYNVFELQGLDDPKKPNASGLKLTYTAKTGSFKGSFTIYCNTGTKLAKYKFDVNGLVLDGMGVGYAVCKKPAMSFPIVVQN